MARLATANINVLVFPCGSEIALEINRCLKDIRFINLFGASSVSDNGSLRYANYIPDVPYCSDPSFVSFVKRIVDEKAIDVIFPAMDDVIPVLLDAESELGCKVVGSTAEVAHICRDKAVTYDTLKCCNFVAAYRDCLDEFVSRPFDFPVLIKPKRGQGSQGVKKISGMEELCLELNASNSDMVICEYLPGKEFTVDCFSDKDGKLRYCACRSRSKTKAGISVDSTLQRPDSEVGRIAAEINARLNMRGVWFFQLKYDKHGCLKLLEIAPRVAGTMCLERAIGVNLPLLTIMDLLGYDVSITPQFDECNVKRALDCKFTVKNSYSMVYMDFDDTLVEDGKVKLETIKFVYQCRNAGIPIVLLTRHVKDIYKSLAESGISESLFSEIHVLTEDETKSSYIEQGSDAIFIDDSYAERKDVFDHCAIKTFGLDNLDVLIND